MSLIHRDVVFPSCFQHMREVQPDEHTSHTDTENNRNARKSSSPESKFQWKQKVARICILYDTLWERFTRLRINVVNE